MQRYNYYIESADAIRTEEISKYKKEWMSKAIDLLPDGLIKEYPDELRILFQEIFNTYTVSMKKAILNYILRSPDERKRLHILMLPRPVPSSSTKISFNGGYNLSKFKGWHARKTEAEQEIKLKLINNNIVMSSIQSWWQDFSEFSFIRWKGLKRFASASNAIDIDSFLAIQDTYR
jgi:dynein heavy chain